MLQLKRQAVEVEIDERDLVTPKDAASLSGRSLQTVLSLMALDTLPIFVLPGDKRKRPQRFTSRKAVQALNALRITKPRIATQTRKTSKK